MIIPAIDLINGQAVRLTQGDYAQKTTYGDPVEIAKGFEAAGLRRLHLVDLDGAKAGKIVNLETLKKISEETNLIVDFSGGIRETKDAEVAFTAGADLISVGSVAARNPDLFNEWLEKFGTDKIILSADCKDKKIAISGWEEETSLDIFKFLASYQEKGIRQVICTDISKDGLLAGAAAALYQEILTKFNDLQLIASGGVSSIEDIESLKQIGVSGIIVGKAIYEGRVTLDQLKDCEGVGGDVK